MSSATKLSGSGLQVARMYGRTPQVDRLRLSMYQNWYAVNCVSSSNMTSATCAPCQSSTVFSIDRWVSRSLPLATPRDLAVAELGLAANLGIEADGFVPCRTGVGDLRHRAAKQGRGEAWLARQVPGTLEEQPIGLAGTGRAAVDRDVRPARGEQRLRAGLWRQLDLVRRDPGKPIILLRDRPCHCQGALRRSSTSQRCPC